MPINVHHFQRYSMLGGYSVERLFSDVRNVMPSDISCQVCTSKYESRGIWRRIYNIVEASRRSGAVNHITGDVQFLAIGLPANRTILTILDCGNLHRIKGLPYYLYKHFWFTWPISRAAVITTISESAKNEIAHFTHYPIHKIRVIHCCISDKFLRVDKLWQKDTVTILTIGTAPNKNLERFAAALEGLPVKVECIGELSPSQSSMFRKHAIKFNELGRLTDDEVLLAYRRCDMLLFASTLEGFGMPIVESQATGRPVVTSNCSSMPEVAGDAACLVDPFDINSIRTGVIRVIEDRSFRESLIEKGFINARRFTPEIIASQYAALYREIAVRK